mmetsp:Transcript_23605/g.43379  ORF Transcript_23605/g.43379 Transcript_23605/m.43379 type:complete len:147 (-) Transcript_23605:130-570(-)
MVISSKKQKQAMGKKTTAAASAAGKAAKTRPLPTRNNSDYQAQQKQRKKNEPQVIRLPTHSKTLSHSPLPSHTYTPLSHTPSGLPSPSPVRLPKPSFGEDDFGILIAGIENMGSIDSIESVSDLVDGTDKHHVVLVADSLEEMTIT